MDHDKSRMQVLGLLEDGQISTEEALRRLNDFANGSGDEPATPTEGSATAFAAATPGANARAESLSPNHDPAMRYWRQWWLIPMFLGIALTLLSSWMMYWAVQSSGVGLWFGCAWFPLVLGLGVTALAWASRHSYWFHVRVNTGEHKWPRQISISLPIPMRLIAWAGEIFGDGLLTFDAPIYIDVNEGEKGERVQVYIG